MKKVFTILFACFLVHSGISQTSQNLNLIYSWTDTSITPVPSLDNQRFNEVWGYSQNGREYAIIGSTMGLHFLDITDTTAIDYVDFVPGAAQGSNIIHRDFKNYNNYLYAVCDEGLSSLQIVDMQYLPDSVHVVYDSDSLIRRAHNLFIDEAKERLYLFGPSTRLFSGGLPPTVGYAVMIFSIADPVNPMYLDTFVHNIIGYVHDGYVFNDTAIFNGGNNGLYYGYMGDTENPVEISSLPFYQDQGYNHSGWLTPDKQHYIMSDETHGMRMKMLDMQPGVNLLSTCDLIGSNVNSFSIPHNQLIRGDKLYVSYYFDGVRVFDISDPCNMVQTAWYDTYPGDAVDGGFAGAWGTYPLLPSGKILVSDMQTGLYVLRPHDMSAGIQDQLVIDFTMSPNPTTDLVNFSEIFNRINVTDINGKTIRNFMNTSSISIADLASGIYMIMVEKDGSKAYKKLIKQ